MDVFKKGVDVALRDTV